jgi:hypothetical protein
MKRSRSGKVIHRDDCVKAGSAVPWNWADGMSDDELFLRMAAYPWLSLCKTCFDGNALELAAKAFALRGGW